MLYFINDYICTIVIGRLASKCVSFHKWVGVDIGWFRSVSDPKIPNRPKLTSIIGHLFPSTHTFGFVGWRFGRLGSLGFVSKKRRRIDVANRRNQKDRNKNIKLKRNPKKSNLRQK